MNPEELKAIKLRLERATGGSWHKIMPPPDTRVCNKEGYMICSVADFTGGKKVPESEWQANQDFIAHSKSDIERLILEVERLRAK